MQLNFNNIWFPPLHPHQIPDSNYFCFQGYNIENYFIKLSNTSTNFCKATYLATKNGVVCAKRCSVKTPLLCCLYICEKQPPLVVCRPRIIYDQYLLTPIIKLRNETKVILIIFQAIVVVFRNLAIVKNFYQNSFVLKLVTLNTVRIFYS